MGLSSSSRPPAWRRYTANGRTNSFKEDLAKLGLLESASNDVYPQLTASNLKQLRINLDSKPTANFKPTFALKIQRPLLEVTDKETRRSLAAYNSPSVTFRSRVRLSGFPTLYSVISSNDYRTPDLGERFKLAHSLAVGLWSFHSLDWLHKSVCSHDILFFPSAISDLASKPTVNAALVPDISSPFLLGFDSSRPEQVIKMNVASRNPSSLDLHRYPSSLEGIDRKSYSKGFDIYSLGLVMLEIRLWKILQAYYNIASLLQYCKLITILQAYYNIASLLQAALHSSTVQGSSGCGVAGPRVRE
ncbi:hypothetical protein GMDG_01161 [Pseudogymnoascus destructans 20631-21]|uniref:Protein kinase domain-containing protein n=2 Tax=Pseudogymnoascus destructans TaxID=655981 RepID=L8FPN6_PSED2|nr:hypothetical protein GMDG_01161 [Pseudogymnoascus destructans 20631-21]